MVKKKWVKIPSARDDMWYMLSSDGEIYREKEVWVDELGTIRGKKATNRKIHKEIRRYEVTRKMKDQGYTVSLKLDNRRSRQHYLHTLVAKYFLPEKPYKSYVLKFIDGNRENVKASNLAWTKRDIGEIQKKRNEEYTEWKKRLNLDDSSDEGKAEKTVKVYKIPSWHILYAKYDAYLRNRQKTSELLLNFMRSHNLYSGLIKVGETEDTKMVKGESIKAMTPFFMFSDKDKAVIEHDLKVLGTDVLKHVKDGFYTIRRGSKTYNDWLNMLKANDNFKVLDVPDISEYVLIHGKNDQDRGKITKLFYMEGEDLYLRLECRFDFDVTDDFIEKEVEKDVSDKKRSR